MDSLFVAALVLWPVCGVVAFALFLRWLSSHSASERDERQHWADRVQAPDVARAAAVEALLSPADREPEPDLYDTPVLRDGDLQLDDLIGRD